MRLSTLTNISTTAARLDVGKVRGEFPILARQVHGKPLVYLDNAATTQKPLIVLEAMDRYYRHYNANIHRGLHTLAEEATAAYEGARERIRRFINAAEYREIIFTRGTTESINLVAASWGRANLKRGDEVLVTHLEHHSNIVPWQMACEAAGAKLIAAPIDDDGQVIMEEFEKRLTPRVKMMAVGHISNSLGTVNPVKTMIAMAKRIGAATLIDGAQAAPHLKIDVRDLGCDFYAFSGHKMYGPTGTGVLYGRAELLEAMPPYQGGGDMIKSCTFEKTEYNELPYKFEAGTPNMVGPIGLAAAADYIDGIGQAAILAHEHEVLEYAAARLKEIAGLRLIGTAKEKASVLSFTLRNIHPYDIAPILDRQGVAVRTGHHCAQPVMERFGVPATIRASLGMYNTREEIDVLVQAIGRAKTMLGEE